MNFKTEQSQSAMFGQRLHAKLKLIDRSCVGENGFSQAIGFATEILSSLNFTLEKKLIDGILMKISQYL